MSKNSMNRIIQSLASVHEPAISLQTYRRVESGIYTVAFTTERSDYNAECITAAFSKVFGGAFSIVKDTLAKAYNPYHNLYTAVAQANVENHAATDENISRLGLKLTTANVFTDDNDNVWQAIGEGDTKRIVLTSTDDYDKILNARRSKTIITASLNTQTPINFGDYVMFFNPKVRAIDFGYATSSETILSKAMNAELKVLPELVMVVADSDSMDIDPLNVDVSEVQAASGNGKKAFLEYWGKLYKNVGQNKFYSDLEALMRKSTEF